MKSRKYAKIMKRYGQKPLLQNSENHYHLTKITKTTYFMDDVEISFEEFKKLVMMYMSCQQALDALRAGLPVHYEIDGKKHVLKIVYKHEEVIR